MTAPDAAHEARESIDIGAGYALEPFGSKLLALSFKGKRLTGSYSDPLFLDCPETRAFAAAMQAREARIAELEAALRVLAEEAGNFGVSGVYFHEKCMGHKGLDMAYAALATTTQPGAEGEGWLTAYLRRQWAWSKETFGPALRTQGVIQHITKELREIEADPHDLMEWVDVAILAMDGFWRHGGKPEDLLAIMQAKQDKNLARSWPDWRTLSEDQAIEHDRSGEGR